MLITNQKLKNYYMQKFVNNYEMKIASKGWYILFCKSIFDVLKVIFYSARGN
jgi:bacillopeptidase F (M6 metalloprotease family)